MSDDYCMYETERMRAVWLCGSERDRAVCVIVCVRELCMCGKRDVIAVTSKF